mgnify:CR=1 FL=1
MMQARLKRSHPRGGVWDATVADVTAWSKLVIKCRNHVVDLRSHHTDHDFSKHDELLPVTGGECSFLNLTIHIVEVSHIVQNYSCCSKLCHDGGKQSG